jgi:hypothetical protein
MTYLQSKSHGSSCKTIDEELNMLKLMRNSSYLMCSYVVRQFGEANLAKFATSRFVTETLSKPGRKLAKPKAGVGVCQRAPTMCAFAAHLHWPRRTASRCASAASVTSNSTKIADHASHIHWLVQRVSFEIQQRRPVQFVQHLQNVAATGVCKKRTQPVQRFDIVPLSVFSVKVQSHEFEDKF